MTMKPLSQRQIFGYSVGDLGINFNFQLIGFFLAYFYTDVFGLAPVHVAGLFLAARVWDAINDPLMGYIADRTQTRRGKFRPYLLFAALPLNLVLLSLFLSPELSYTGKLVYAYVTYILHGMLFTVVGLPYSAITAVMTQDQQERAVISTYRMFFAAVVAVVLVSVGIRPFVALFANEQQGFAATAAIFAVVSVALIWIAYGRSEERIDVPHERYKVTEILPMLLRNDALLVLGAAMCLNTCVWVVMNASAAYYFKYLLDDSGGGIMSTYYMITQIGSVGAVIATPFMTKRFGKVAVFMAGSVVVTLFYGGRFFLPLHLLNTFYMVSIIGAFGQMMCSITQWGMVPDTVEYGHWKTNVRSEGMPFAFFSLMQKLGLALGGFIAAIGLDWIGYVANVAQSESTRTGIAALFSLAPGAFSVLCLILLLFYRIDGKLFQKITAELAERAKA